MKHFKKLMYNVIQWHLKPVVGIGAIVGAPGAIWFNSLWLFLFGIIGTLVAAIANEHYNLKKQN